MGKVLYYFCKTNWLKTLWFNFKFLPFAQARRIPFFIARHTQIGTKKNAKVSICCEDSAIFTGMIRLGFANMPVQIVKSNPLSIYLNEMSSLVFNGSGRISAGSQVFLLKGSSVTFGNDFHISMDVKIYSQESITLGDYITVGWGTQIMDTDFHATISRDTGNTYPQTKPIIIGNHCWICTHCQVMKGTVIPDNVIVGSKSLCNKRYDVPSYSVIAGTPAVFRKEGLTYER